MAGLSKFHSTLEKLPSSICLNKNQLFRRGQLGEFTVADTSYFVGKYVLLSKAETFLANPVSGGFGHNQKPTKMLTMKC